VSRFGGRGTTAEEHRAYDKARDVAVSAFMTTRYREIEAEAIAQEEAQICERCPKHAHYCAGSVLSRYMKNHVWMHREMICDAPPGYLCYEHTIILSMANAKFRREGGCNECKKTLFGTCTFHVDHVWANREVRIEGWP
jgi:hypothetical protein